MDYTRALYGLPLRSFAMIRGKIGTLSTPQYGLRVCVNYLRTLVSQLFFAYDVQSYREYVQVTQDHFYTLRKYVRVPKVLKRL